ncbi:MAG: lysylphosphatidylglycerol synthase domain-containing protein [Fibrobacterota bacterium]
MRRSLGILLGIAVTTGLAIWAGPVALVNRFLDVPLRFLALMFGALFLGEALRLYKFRIALKSLLSFREAASIFLYSRLPAYAPPHHMADLVPLLHSHTRKKDFAAFIVVDRAFEAAALVLVGGFGIVNHVHSLILYAVWSLLLGVAAFLIILLYRRNGHLTRFIRTLRDNASAFRAFLFTLSALTLTAVLMDVCAFQLLVKSLGHGMTLSYAGFMLAGMALAGLLSFLPGGLGVSDAACAILLVAHGAERAAAGGVALFHRAIELIRGALYFGVLVLLRRPS